MTLTVEGLSPVRFGRFELDPAGRRLLEDGRPVALGARAFDLLVVLVERAGRLVTKNDLLALVWPGLVVEENNLQVQISTLRKQLGPSALATIPGRGYRFDLAVVVTAPLQAADAENAHPPAADATPTSATRTNLPARLPPLFGRDDDVAALGRLLHDHALVTAVGAGGIGKTRVAQATAMAAAQQTDYPDGVWWVELASLSDAALVPATVAHALSIKLDRNRPPAEALTSALAAQRLLLVVDNCEHLVDAVAVLVETLRAGAPRASVLVTSQETLKVAEENVYRIGPLAVPADAADAPRCGAVELFVARARSVDPNFTLTPANTPGVAEICRRLDGIPLAIELAAARLPLLGVEGLRARLDERFSLLTAGARVVLRRHQTLRATLEWSHALLTPDEQTVFRRLGVFAGGFTLEAAQHVAGDARIDAWMALDLLGALVDKSLVQADGDPIPRYHLLETTRAYAVERLAEAGETQATLRRHAEAIHALLAQFDDGNWLWRATTADMRPPAAELDNLRAALDWADRCPEGRDLAIPLAAVSHSVWLSVRFLAEGLERCLALRPHLDASVPKVDAAGFLLTIARMGLYAMRRESYEAALQAAELLRELGDGQRRYDALNSAAIQGIRCASVDDVAWAIAEAEKLYRPEWPARERAALEFSRCWWLSRQGRAEEALAAAQRQVAIARDGDAEVASMFAMSNVTAMELQLGRPEDALVHARASIERLDALGATSGAGHLYGNAMTALVLLDRLDEAQAAGRIAYSLLAREGDELRLLPALELLAAKLGRLEDAARVRAFDRAVHGGFTDGGLPHLLPLYEHVDALLAAGLPPERRAVLDAEGALLHAGNAFRAGFGDDR